MNEHTVITPPLPKVTNMRQTVEANGFFRRNEQGENEISGQMHPNGAPLDWVRSPARVAGMFTRPNINPGIGEVIAALNNEALRLDRVEAENRKMRDDRDRALGVIGMRLIEEAENRGWCTEFDEIIDEVNAALPDGWELPERKREFTIEIEVTGTIRTTTSVTVEAKTEDEAREMIDDGEGEHYDSDDILTRAAKNVSFDDVEVEIQDVSS